MVKGRKDYLVSTEQAEKLADTYESADTTSDVSENLSEKNNIVALSLTSQEAERLKKNASVDVLEEDLEVKACENEKEVHEKVVDEKKTNEEEQEWNLQMIITYRRSAVL